MKVQICYFGVSTVRGIENSISIVRGHHPSDSVLNPIDQYKTWTAYVRSPMREKGCASFGRIAQVRGQYIQDSASDPVNNRPIRNMDICTADQ